MVDFTYNDYQKILDEALETYEGDGDEAWVIADLLFYERKELNEWRHMATKYVDLICDKEAEIVKLKEENKKLADKLNLAYYPATFIVDTE